MTEKEIADMTEKELQEAADQYTEKYIMHRGVARIAFVEGALWALEKSKEILKNLNSEIHEESEMLQLH